VAAVQPADRGRQQRAVADLGDRLVGVEEGLEDLAQLRVVAQVLGGPSAGDHHGRVLAGFHLRERQVRRPGVAGLLGVRVETRLEVVDDEAQLLAGGGGDVDLVPLLAQTLVGVQDLQGFRRVSGDDQDLHGHHCLPLLGGGAKCLTSGDVSLSRVSNFRAGFCTHTAHDGPGGRSDSLDP
jgi:hypothetical protein